MNTIITVTQQWQVYIPEEIRRILNWINPFQARLEVKDRSLVITPQRSSVLALFGKYKKLAARKPVNLANIRGEIDYSRL